MSERYLIVYGTKHGHTEKIAQRIATRLRERGASVDVIDARDRLGLPLADYGTVVLASGVWYDRHAKSIEKFVFRNLAQLRTMKTALVSVSGAASTEAGKPVAAETVSKFRRYTEFEPGRILLIGGGEPYTKYGWWTRMIMLRIAKQHGRTRDPKVDYDYTDWNAVDEFATLL